MSFHALSSIFHSRLTPMHLVSKKIIQTFVFTLGERMRQSAIDYLVTSETIRLEATHLYVFTRASRSALIAEHIT